MAGVIVIKEIKPSRFNEDRFGRVLLDAMKEAEKGMLADFEKTTATWEHDVKFETARSVSLARSPTVHVLTTDRIYNYVNNGTDPHPIFAGIYTGLSSKKALAFRSKYRAKTQPGVIGSTGGGASGSMVIRPYVQHPGTEARKFDKEIRKKWTPRFKRLMEKAMRRAARASGHGVP